MHELRQKGETTETSCVSFCLEIGTNHNHMNGSVTVTPRVTFKFDSYALYELKMQHRASERGNFIYSNTNQSYQEHDAINSTLIFLKVYVAKGRKVH